jgi:CDP-2,3-bis-(O-geranylgeranyl)-sn-glycerol synthase
MGNSLPIPRSLRPLLLKLDIPVDLGKKLGGKEIFGRNKTFRGFAVGIVTGIFVTALQYLLFLAVPFFRENTLIDFSRINFALVGFLMGFGALLGDLIKSFFKRRLNKRPGLPWFPFDQLDWILASLILTATVYVPPLDYLLGTIAVYVLVHLCSDRIVQRLGLKKKEDVYKNR